MKTSIIIPFRDRSQQLSFLLDHCLKFFQSYIKDVEIIIIEQLDDKKFNRGKLLNIGFNESDFADFIITHDVDIIPSEKLIKEFYTINSYDALRIFTGHKNSLGGICKLSNSSFKKVNGFPNNIWGWGIEDRALFYRYMIHQSNISDYLRPSTSNMVKILPHKPNNESYIGPKKDLSDTEDRIFNKAPREEQLNYIQKSGLNNLQYEIFSIKKINDITKIVSVSL